MELKDKLNEIKELSQELQNKIDELSGELEEEKKDKEKKDKIKLLDEYMKNLDERLFVEGTQLGYFVALSFLDERDNDWGLCFIDKETNKMWDIPRGMAPKKIFNKLVKYKHAFKGKYDELFKEEER